MKIVIDIPEDAYNNKTLVNYFGCYSEKLNELIYNAPTNTFDKIINKIEQARDKDKLCKYPYYRCIDIIKEEIEK